ncbi:MAG: glycosyltransferase family 2 protein [Bacteroidales bacterium]|nr:glycosyltransferase family 2 protein [Bacteroidales bacterium]
MALIQVFIPTYNRPKTALKTVESVCKQSFKDYELIISDNSTDNQTKEIFANYSYSNIKYIKREPSLTAIDHFNRILFEVTSDFFMIFHDDDIMHDNMLECLYNAIIKNEEIISVGSNAFIARNGNISNKKLFKASRRNLVLTNPIDVAKQYIKIGGIVPFSSYIYKNKVAQELKFDSSKGGKYCDAAFILDISTLGKILFLAKPLMYFSIHQGQDSFNYSYTHSTALLKYVCKVTGLMKGDKLIKEYRIRNIYLELKQGILYGRIILFSRRYLRMVFILFKESLFLYFPRILVLSFISTFKISIKKYNISFNSYYNNKLFQ